MVCKHCGKEIPDNSKECPECKKALVQKKIFNPFAKDLGPFEKSIVGMGLAVLILIILPLSLFGALSLHNTQEASGDTPKAIVCGIFAVICLVLVFACIMLTLLPMFNGVDGLLYCKRSWVKGDKKMILTCIFSAVDVFGVLLILSELVIVVSTVMSMGLV